MLKSIIVLCCLAISAALVYAGLPSESLMMRFAQPDTDKIKTGRTQQPFYTHSSLPHEVTPSVHSATAAALPDGRLISCWYGGTREGHRDVRVWCAYYQQERWSAAYVVMTREQTAQATGTYIKKLGNPVLYFSAQRQQLWLFYVSVSLGGWSTSQINLTVSEDMGQTWSPPQRLISSPFMNLSTLVKNPPVAMQNGYLALPAYHEGLTKFSELLLIDPATRQVAYKSRISHRGSGIQPYLFVADHHNAMVVMRNTVKPASATSGQHAGRMLFTTTENGGLTWQPVRASALLNPNAAVGGLATAGLPWLVVFNNHPATRENLSLAARIHDHWQPVYTLAERQGGRFAYPWLLQDQAGQFHLLFTNNRTRIDHIRFNRTWLTGQIAASREQEE